MYHTVIPIFNGMFTVTTVDRPPLPTIRDIPVFCFLVQTIDGKYILVDTGLSPAYIPSLEGFVAQADGERLERALPELGVKPEQIETVIQTHLHWDHTAALAAFPRAEIIVQAAELQSLFRLMPNEDTYYYYDAWYNELPRMRAVNGNVSLQPGLELVFSGGHTLGHQLVRVQTREGVIVLAGDLSSNYDDLWRLVPERFWQQLRRERPQKCDWHGELLPAVRRLLQSQHMWDAPACAPLAWKELKASGCRILLGHDPLLNAARTAK